MILQLFIEIEIAECVFQENQLDALRMTVRRYWRLFLVSVVPLLLLGLLFAAFVLPYPRHRYVLCNAVTQGCNWGTEDYDHFEAVKKLKANDNEGWFWISEGFESGYLEDTIESRTKVILDAKIIEVGSDSLKPLVGRPVEISLGIPNEKKSLITGSGVILQCDRLVYLLEGAHYETYCYGDGWDGPVNFTVPVDSGGFRLLEGLKSEIETVRSDRRWDFALYCLIVLPMFVYLFFVISAIVWLTTKAVRFVKGG